MRGVGEYFYIGFDPLPGQIARVRQVRRLRQCRTVRLAREYVRFFVHDIRLSEQLAREKLEVEAELAGEQAGDRPVEVDSDLYSIAVACSRDLIFKLEVRVDHRVEVAEIVFEVGVFQLGYYAVGIIIELAVELL